MYAVIVLVFCLGAVAAHSENPARIVNGRPATINEFPYAAALMYGWAEPHFYLACGGAIIGDRTMLTAAHCVMDDMRVINWRVLAGATSVTGQEGATYHVVQIMLNPNFNRNSFEADIALLRLSISVMTPVSTIPYASFGSVVPDNAEVQAIGWGSNEYMAAATGQLQQVQLVRIPFNECREQYARLNRVISTNTICSGFRDTGSVEISTTEGTATDEEPETSGPRGHCHGDDGGPLIFNGTVVGVYSWGHECGLAHPSVNTLVSSYSVWIQVNNL